jgi:hypothetical protein
LGKEVRFTWNWNFSSVVADCKTCLKELPVRSGSVALKKFDDGWRVYQWGEKIEIEECRD